MPRRGELVEPMVLLAGRVELMERLPQMPHRGGLGGNQRRAPLSTAMGYSRAAGCGCTRRCSSLFALNGAFCPWPGRGKRLLRAKLFWGGAGA